MSEIELRYAPRKCKHFCCGDCVLDGKSCGHDISDDTVCIEKYNKIKQECEELKAYRDVMEQADFKGGFDKMCIENRKLRRALQEIQGTAHRLRTYNYYHSIDDVNDDLDSILIKISEVENDK